MPWGAEPTITPGYPPGRPVRIDATGPAFDAARAAFSEAWGGADLLQVGTGGSIPIVEDFARVSRGRDPRHRCRGPRHPRPHPNEGLRLAEWERVCLAETLLMHHLASATGDAGATGGT